VCNTKSSSMTVNGPQPSLYTERERGPQNQSIAASVGAAVAAAAAASAASAAGAIAAVAATSTSADFAAPTVVGTTAAVAAPCTAVAAAVVATALTTILFLEIVPVCQRVVIGARRAEQCRGLWSLEDLVSHANLHSQEHIAHPEHLSEHDEYTTPSAVLRTSPIFSGCLCIWLAGGSGNP
jgi:hypothetical protein